MTDLNQIYTQAIDNFSFNLKKKKQQEICVKKFKSYASSCENVIVSRLAK